MVRRPPTPPASRRSCSPRRRRPTSACRASAPRLAGLRLRRRPARRHRRADRRWPPAPSTMAARLKAVTDLPVLVGVGVSNAAQAARGRAGGRRRHPGRVGRAPPAGRRPRRGRRLRRRGAGRDRRARSGVTARARSTAVPCTQCVRVRADATSALPVPSTHGRLRPVRGGADHPVVPRGRPVLDRRVRDLRRADGRVEGPRPDPPDRREGGAPRAPGRRSSPSTSTSSTTSTTTCATSRTTTTPTPAHGRLLRSRAAPALTPRTVPRVPPVVVVGARGQGLRPPSDANPAHGCGRRAISASR